MVEELSEAVLNLIFKNKMQPYKHTVKILPDILKVKF